MTNRCVLVFILYIICVHMLPDKHCVNPQIRASETHIHTYENYIQTQRSLNSEKTNEQMNKKGKNTKSKKQMVKEK